MSRMEPHRRFRHELLLTKVRGRLIAQCRCGVQIGTFKPEQGASVEDSHDEAVASYQAHMRVAGIVEREKVHKIR